MNLSGIGVSAGVAIGPVFRVDRTEVSEPVAATPDEVFAALNVVADELEHRADTVSLDVARDVLSAQAMIARDPALIEALAARLTESKIYPDVRPAVDGAFSGFKEALSALGDYFAERVADLDEIAQRTLAVLSGAEPTSFELHEPSIIVATDLTPSDTAALDLNFAKALVVERGGPTSHTAIVARGLGIPAIVGCVGITEVLSGTRILVDGRDGVIEIEPSQDVVTARTTREDALRARAAAVQGPGRLLDKTPIALLANSGNAQDAVVAATAGAEGIGLFRTELLFLDREDEPTVAEQVALYSAVFDAMAGRRVVVRTLDAGSDKPVPFINAETEENPALGVRGWRLTRIADDVLSRQLDAIAQAAQNARADVWVMAPMIDTVAEAADFAMRARKRGIRAVGVMIETPAAALLADKILAEVDFASLGTNDLTQYVMAADRLDSRLSDLTSSWHPAVLRIIGSAGDAATTLSRPIGVCGEAAASPHLAAVLVGLGVTSLSMAPSALAEVRGFLSGVDRATCIKAAQAACNAASAEDAQAIARVILGD